MSTPIHDDIEAWLALELCDGLDPEAQRDLEKHLATCPACRARHQEQILMNEILESRFATLRPTDALPERMITAFRQTFPRAGNGAGSPTRLLAWLAWLGEKLRQLPRLPAVQITAVLASLLALIQLGGSITREPVNSGQPGGTKVPLLGDIPIVGSLFRSAQDKEYQRTPEAAGSIRGLADRVEADSPMGADQAKSLSAGTFSLRNRVQPKDQFMAVPSAASPPAPAQFAQAMGGRGGGGAASSDASRLPSSALKERPITNTTASSIAGAAVPPPSTTTGTPDARKLIRNASVTYEVASFDTSVATITALTSQAGGFIATTQSARLQNNKLTGTLVVKVLPQNLDGFLLQLRTLGELKNQSLTTDDITKAYTDTDSRLRNSRKMEDRLLDLLDKTKGKVTDLLEVEKELARVRGEIEEMQGQLKVYDSLVAFATITIQMSEKDLTQPAAFLLQERAQLALYAADVETTFLAARAAADAVKAQIVQSQLNRDESGRVTATLEVLLAPDVSASTITKIKALGRIQNFTSQVNRIAQGGTGPDGENARVERDKTDLNLVINQDQERSVETASLIVETKQVEEQSLDLKQRAATRHLEVTRSSFERQPDGREIAQLTFRLKYADYSPFLAELKKLGHVRSFTVSRPDQPILLRPADRIIGGSGPDARDTTPDSPAEISLVLVKDPDVINADNGFFATLRRTLTQSFGALTWSLRMILVALSCLLPFAIALVAVLWVWRRSRRRARKS